MTFSLFGRKVYIRKGIIISAAAILLASIGMAGFLIRGNSSTVVIDKHVEEAEENRVQTVNSVISPGVNGQVAEKKEEPDNQIKVYVVGCVKKRGIVTLQKGQIIDDAINAAGGATEDADLENINLAYRLTENVMIRVKSKTDNRAGGDGQVNQTSGSTDGTKKGVEIIKDSGGAVVDEYDDSSGQKAKININTASVDELDTLPGVGKETAKDIVSYREKNGKFKTITDIMRVPGIKDSKYNQIKDFIEAE